MSYFTDNFTDIFLKEVLREIIRESMPHILEECGLISALQIQLLKVELFLF